MVAAVGLIGSGSRCEITKQGLANRAEAYGGKLQPPDRRLAVGDRYTSESGCFVGDRTLGRSSFPGGSTLIVAGTLLVVLLLGAMIMWRRGKRRVQ